MTNTPVSPGTSADGHRSPARPPLTHQPHSPGLGTTGKVLLAVIGLVFLACASPKPDSSAGGAAGAGQASNGGAPTAPEAGASKDSPAPVGTDVSPAKDWTIRVVSADRNANAALAKENQFNKPQTPGNQFVVVTVEVHNNGSKPEASLAAMSVGLLVPSGQKLNQTFASAGGTFDITTQLQPGGVQTGKLIYEAAPAEAAGAVLLAEPFITLDKNEDQRFLALS